MRYKPKVDVQQIISCSPLISSSSPSADSLGAGYMMTMMTVGTDKCFWPDSAREPGSLALRSVRAIMTNRVGCNSWKQVRRREENIKDGRDTSGVLLRPIIRIPTLVSLPAG